MSTRAFKDAAARLGVTTKPTQRDLQKLRRSRGTPGRQDIVDSFHDENEEDRGMLEPRWNLVGQFSQTRFRPDTGFHRLSDPTPSDHSPGAPPSPPIVPKVEP